MVPCDLPSTLFAGPHRGEFWVLIAVSGPGKVKGLQDVFSGIGVVRKRITATCTLGVAVRVVDRAAQQNLDYAAQNKKQKQKLTACFRLRGL